MPVAVADSAFLDEINETESDGASPDLSPPPPPPPSSSNNQGAGSQMAQLLMQFRWVADVDVEQPNETKPNLRFDRQGNVSGTTGCNSFRGTYELNGSQIRFEVQTLTKKECTDEQETRFLQALKQARYLKANDEGIAITGSGSELLVQLKTGQ